MILLISTFTVISVYKNVDAMGVPGDGWMRFSAGTVTEVGALPVANESDIQCFGDTKCEAGKAQLEALARQAEVLIRGIRAGKAKYPSSLFSVFVPGFSTSTNPAGKSFYYCNDIGMCGTLSLTDYFGRNLKNMNIMTQGALPVKLGLDLNLRGIIPASTGCPTMSFDGDHVYMDPVVKRYPDKELHGLAFADLIGMEYGTLILGSRGEIVKALQTFLRSRSEALYPADAPISGYFGTATQQSVKNYQFKRVIPDVLGTVGLATRKDISTALRNCINKAGIIMDGGQAAGYDVGISATTAPVPTTPVVIAPVPEETYPFTENPMFFCGVVGCNSVRDGIIAVAKQVETLVRGQVADPKGASNTAAFVSIVPPSGSATPPVPSTSYYCESIRNCSALRQTFKQSRLLAGARGIPTIKSPTSCPSIFYYPSGSENLVGMAYDSAMVGTAYNASLLSGSYVNLVSGAKGDIVKALQIFLLARPESGLRSNCPVVADCSSGIFGPLTALAVTNFQRGNAIVSDTAGVVGPATRQKISEILRTCADTSQVDWGS